MSVEFYAFECDVMEWDTIKMIVPDEAAGFEEQLKAAGVSMDDFCEAMCQDDWDFAEFSSDDEDAIEEAIDQIEATWDRVRKAFTEATSVEGAGLRLTPGYHDPDYEEEPIAYFAVEGVYQLTSAGAKYEDKIERRQFTGVG